MGGVASPIHALTRSARSLLPALAGLVLACPGVTWAQAGDSADAVRAATRAQRRFETIRRVNLPLVASRGRSECDAVIGPYCYWYDPYEAPHRPAEPARVTAARGELLRVLDAVGGRWPALNIIAGQRVRYRLDGADTIGAVRLATAECRADRWWCSALAGYALHVAGNFAGAAAAFDDAIARMPSAKRCEWADLSSLLEGAARRRFASLPCEDREREARRIWWLATPLLSAQANDFHTEYLTRRVAAELEAADPVMFGQRWNRYAEEMLLRFGRQEWWTRERPAAIGSTAGAHIVGHELVPSFAFIPSERVLRDSTLVPAPYDWATNAKLPASRYAPAYARFWRDIEAQVARFRRGDSLLVVAAYDVTGDTSMRAPAATLALSSRPGGATYRSARIARATAGAVRVAAPASALGVTALASLEIVDSSRGAVARHRTGIQPLPAQRIALSDLLVHRPAPGRTGAAPSLDEVAARALPSHAITGSEIGVYWETYESGAAGTRTLTLTLERTDRSVLTRAATRLGITDPPHPIRIRWRDEAGGLPGRSVVINLRGVPDGDYVVRLTVTRDDGASGSTARAVVIDR